MDELSIAIVGAGSMGKGIAEVASVCGVRTILIKGTPGGLEEVCGKVTASLDRAVERGKIDARARDAAIARLTFTCDRTAVAECDLVIESVVEDLAVKQSLLAEIERAAPRDAVIATNTSSLRVTAVGEQLEGADRFLGMHFFSPVSAMKLVEVAPTRATAPFAVERAKELAARLGKTPVLVGDSSGYIVNRLLVPYLLDGLLALEAGVAAAPDIDTAMRLGCGHPIGPLALADAIGLDVVYAMARTLYAELHDQRYSPPALLRRLVVRGQLGKKSRVGVYDYRVDPPAPNRDLSHHLEGSE